MSEHGTGTGTGTKLEMVILRSVLVIPEFERGTRFRESRESVWSCDSGASRADEFRDGTSAGGVTGDVTGSELVKICQQSHISVTGHNMSSSSPRYLTPVSILWFSVLTLKCSCPIIHTTEKICTPQNHAKSNPPWWPYVSALMRVKTTKGTRASWTMADETAFISFLQELVGHSVRFTPMVWEGAAVEMQKHTTIWGTKSAGSCSSRWNQVGYVCFAFTPHVAHMFSSWKSCLTLLL